MTLGFSSCTALLLIFEGPIPLDALGRSRDAIDNFMRASGALNTDRRRRREGGRVALDSALASAREAIDELRPPPFVESTVRRVSLQIAREEPPDDAEECARRSEDLVMNWDESELPVTSELDALSA